MSTNTSFKHFNYVFIMNINSGTDSSVPEKLYRFKSDISGRKYLVHVEIHPKHFYGVKFHLKDDTNCKEKYNRLTGLNEVRPLVRTCMAIMLDIHNQDSRSSFGFIGSNIISEKITKNGKSYLHENTINTKRYRVYKRLMLTYFSDEIFLHLVEESKSTYMMIRKTELNLNPSLVKEISDYFTHNYDYFNSDHNSQSY